MTLDELLVVDLANVDPAVQEFLSAKQIAANRTPRNGTVIGELAISYEMNGFPDHALVGYRHAAKLAPQDSRWPYYEALILANYGDYPRALESLDRTLTLNPDYAAGWVWKGHLLLELNELPQSERAYQSAIDLGLNVVGTVGIVQVLLRKNETRQALDLLNELSHRLKHPHLDQLTRNARLRLGLAVDPEQSSNNVPRGSIGWLDPLSADKRTYEVSISAEISKFRQLIALPDSRDEGFELIDKLYAKYPDAARVVIAKAHSLRLRNDAQRLRTLLEHAHESWPNESNFTLGLAELEIAAQNASAAALLLDAVLLKEPRNAWALLQRGVLHASTGDFNKAVEKLRAAIAIEEGAEVHYYLGHAYAELSDWQKAYCHMARTVELDQTFLDAANQLVRLEELQRESSADTTSARSLNQCATEKGI